MKRLLSLFLILALLFTSCGKSDEKAPEANDAHTSTEATTETSNLPEIKDPPSHTHSYASVVIEATCLAGGYTTHTCTTCNDQYVSDATSPLGHTEETVPGKAATETENGLTDGKKCSVCNAVTLPQTEIPATGSAQTPHTHAYTSVVTEPTCTADGYTTFTCSGCNDSYTSNIVNALGHTEVTVPGKAPTCTEAGLTDGKQCTVCGTTTVAQTTLSVTAHTEEIIPGRAATETEDGLTDGKKCSVCGTVTLAQSVIPAIGNTQESHTHTYTSTVTSPTCTKDGYTTYTCSGCSNTYTSDIVLALGHSEEVVDGTAPTCTEAGLSAGKACTVCGVVTIAPTTIPATGHTEIIVTGAAATCSKTGLTDGKKCSTCGTETLAQTTIPTIAHTETVVSAKSATCTTAGLTEGKKCSVCGTVTLAQTTIPATGHTEVVVSGRVATCVDTGLTDGKECSVCGTVTVVQTTIAALGHNWTDATTEAPKTCLTCGATEGEKLPASSSTTYSNLTVTYIDVGQGDSIFIKVDDCDILIDAGKPGKGSTVSSYLKSKGVDDIELMINSHPDDDHYGGLSTVLSDFKVEKFWGSSYAKTASSYTTFKNSVSAEGLTFTTPSVGAVYTYEYLTLTVIYNGSGASNSNDSSLVILLEYGSFRFLFTGDISTTIENKIVNKDISCDVLKVPHHGSAGSSAAAFLNATGADYAVICVGAGNSYGHPKEAALSRLSSAGMTTYRTDLNGTVVFTTNGSSMTTPGGTVNGGSGGSSSGGSTSGGSSSGSTDTSGQIFIGNTETKVFHLPTCSNLPAASKQNQMYNYYWIINIAGYTPCGRCMKNYTPGSSSGGSSGTTSYYIANTDSKVYHLPTCSYLPATSKQKVIYSTSGYTPCGHCIKSTSTTKYIANTETNVYHLTTCSYLPATSKQKVIYDTSGYTPCGHCIK